MAGKGRTVTFHGAFSSKAKAVKKERSVHGFIRKKKINGSLRYMVLKRRGK